MPSKPGWLQRPGGGTASTVRSVHQLEPPAPRNRQEVRREPLPFVHVLRAGARAEVLLVEGAHQLDVHGPDRDMFKLHVFTRRSVANPWNRGQIFAQRV